MSVLRGGVLSLVLLVAVQLVLVSPLVAQGESTSPPPCRPGEFAYNASGSFICVPAATNATTPVGSITVYYVNETHVVVNMVCQVSIPCRFRVELVNTTSGDTVAVIEEAVEPGNVEKIYVDVGTPYPLYVEAEANDVSMPAFVVPPYVPARNLDPILSTPVLALLFSLLVASVPFTLFLRANVRMGAIALLLTLAPLYKIVTWMGVDPTVAVAALGAAAALAVLVALFVK